MVMCGLSVFFILVVTSKTHAIIMSCIFNGIGVMAWNAIDVLGAEMYPTGLRFVNQHIVNLCILALLPQTNMYYMYFCFWF